MSLIVDSSPTALARKRPPRDAAKLKFLRTKFLNSPYYALHSIECHCEAGVVILRGMVVSYFLKQMAQEIVFHSLGRIELRNDIEVLPQELITFIS